LERTQVQIPAAQLDRQRDFEAKLKEMHAARPLRALVDTFGCQQNVADSQHIMGMLRAMGCSFTDDPAQADVVVLNTCAIRDHAEKRVYGNLGALTVERGSFDSHGLLYQWGRKDPFPGTTAFTIMNEDYTYEVDGEPEVYGIDNRVLPKFGLTAEFHGTIEKSIQNPAVFYAMTYKHTGVEDEYGEEIVENDYKTGDWVDVSNDDYWGGESRKKTIYDPCPVGYKVPVCDADGNTPYAWLVYTAGKWDEANRGFEQEGQWFPTTGTRAYASGGLDYTEANPYSGLWIGTKGKASDNLELYPDLYGQYMFIIDSKRMLKVSKDKRSQGMSLRCVKE